MNCDTDGQRKRISLVPIIKVTAALLLSLSLSSIVHANPQVIWMGCGITKKAFMGVLSKRFTEKTGITFRQAGGGATKGIRLTASKDAHIGGSCRHRLTGRNQQVIPLETNVKLIHTAWDALVLITNQNNAVINIASDRVKGIFSGDITNWAQLGGSDQDIKLLVRAGKTSGVGYMFRELVLQDANYNYPASAITFTSSGPLEKNIARRFRYGIAVTGISSAKKRAVNILTLDGVYPSKENLMAGLYPYFRPLYMVTAPNPDPYTQRFIDFVLSDEGQALISQEGTVNLKEGQLLQKRWTLTELPAQI